MMGKEKSKDKEHQDGETTASSETITSPRDACWEREASDAALAKTSGEAVTREMAKAHA